MNDASTAELARISAALLDALRQAHGLAQAGEYGEPLRDCVAFCRGLVAIANETLAAAPQAGEHARGMAKHTGVVLGVHRGSAQGYATDFDSLYRHQRIHCTDRRHG